MHFKLYSQLVLTSLWSTCLTLSPNSFLVGCETNYMLPWDLGGPTGGLTLTLTPTRADALTEGGAHGSAFHLDLQVCLQACPPAQSCRKFYVVISHWTRTPQTRSLCSRCPVDFGYCSGYSSLPVYAALTANTLSYHIFVASIIIGMPMRLL